MTTFFEGVFAFGIMILSYPLAYCLREWRQLQQYIGLFCLPTIILGFFIPESYKFLVSQKRGEEAYEISLKMLAKNRSKFLKNDYQVSEDSKEILRSNINAQIQEIEAKEKEALS